MNARTTATVAAGAGYLVGSPSSVTNFITDDDRNVVTITADGPLAFEGGTNGSLTVARSGDTNASLTVSLTITGTAASGTDYTNNPTPATSITLAAGQAARTISIYPINDALTEGDEMVLVQIGSGSYDIGAESYASVEDDPDRTNTVGDQLENIRAVKIALSGS